MATKKQLDDLLSRALRDPAFERRLFKDPQAAGKEAGYALTDQQAETINRAAHRLKKHLDVLRKKIGPQGWPIRIVPWR